MKKLIEVEMDGQAAVKHVGDLRDVVRRLREVNISNCTHALLSISHPHGKRLTRLTS